MHFICDKLKNLDVHLQESISFQESEAFVLCQKVKFLQAAMRMQKVALVSDNVIRDALGKLTGNSAADWEQEAPKRAKAIKRTFFMFGLRPLDDYGEALLTLDIVKARKPIHEAFKIKSAELRARMVCERDKLEEKMAQTGLRMFSIQQGLQQQEILKRSLKRNKQLLEDLEARVHSYLLKVETDIETQVQLLEQQQQELQQPPLDDLARMALRHRQLQRSVPDRLAYLLATNMQIPESETKAYVLKIMADVETQVQLVKWQRQQANQPPLTPVQITLLQISFFDDIKVEVSATIMAVDEEIQLIQESQAKAKAQFQDVAQAMRAKCKSNSSLAASLKSAICMISKLDETDPSKEQMVDELIGRIAKALGKMSLVDPGINKAIGAVRASMGPPPPPDLFDWQAEFNKLPPVYQGPNARHLGIDAQSDGRTAYIQAQIQVMEAKLQRENQPPMTGKDSRWNQCQTDLQYRKDYAKNAVREMAKCIVALVQTWETETADSEPAYLLLELEHDNMDQRSHVQKELARNFHPLLWHLRQQSAALCTLHAQMHALAHQAPCLAWNQTGNQQMQIGLTEGEGVENIWSTLQVLVTVVGYISPEYSPSLLPLLMSIYYEPMRAPVILYDFGADFSPPPSITTPSDENDEPVDLPALVP
ncbi:hypothetical protein C8J56DRAFT_1020172 [Mycena floridula]|nr:hypothetical protein C8J56DRAFT_1020172 [Mycena floridula]